MKKLGIIGFLALALCVFCSWTHKFYVGIYQVNYASDKKMLQVTTRIFVDDLNDALAKRFSKKFHLGEKNVPADEVQLMNKYVLDNFRIAVNGKSEALDYRSYEMEDNVLVAYYRIVGVANVKTLAFTNKVLFDFVTEQQNIIQTNVGGNKQTLLLTIDEPSGKLGF